MRTLIVVVQARATRSWLPPPHYATFRPRRIASRPIFAAGGCGATMIDIFGVSRRSASEVRLNRPNFIRHK